MKNTFYHSQQQFKSSFLWEIDLADLKGLAELANLTVYIYQRGCLLEEMYSYQNLFLLLLTT